MNEIKDRIYPGLGGLNTDDNIWTMPNTDSRYRLNVVVDDDGDKNVLVNSEGNTQKSATLPAGDNQVVGFVEDVEDKAGIYFVRNSNGNNRILRLNSVNNTITTIFDENDFNFIISGFYVDAVVIGSGDSKYLVWVTSGSQPNQINIDKAISGGYASSTEQEISVIKKPPFLDGFGLVYINTFSFEYNYLQGDIFQFSTRFRYDDNTYSVYSELASVLPITSSTELVEGFTIDLYKNNAIRVTIQDIPDNVEKIELVYRRLSTESGTYPAVPSNFYLYGTYDRTSSSKVILFYGEKVLSTVATGDVLKQYDSVPQQAKAVEIINGNRIAFGGITEGYDSLSDTEIDLDLDEVTAAVTITADVKTTTSPAIISSGGGTGTLTVTRNDSFYTLFVTTLKISSGESLPYYGYSFEDLNSLTSYVVNWINTNISDVVTTNGGGGVINITNNKASGIELYLIEYKPQKSQYTFKPGSNIKLGLLYFDDYGRSSFVSTSEDTSIDISTVADNQATYIDGAYKSSIQYTIRHQAPSWAKHWSWCMTTSNIPLYYRFTMVKSTVETPYVYIKLDDVTSLGVSDVFTPYNFEPQAKDKLVIIQKYEGSTDTTSALSDYVELDIIEYDSTTNTIKVAYNSNLIITGIDYNICEIYRPPKDFGANVSYYQIGGVGSVTASSGNYYHEKISNNTLDLEFGVSGQDQTAVQACVGTLDFGSSYASYGFPVEVDNSFGVYKPERAVNVSLSAFSFLDYRVLPTGKPYVVNNTNSQKYYNNIRYGGILNPSSGINNAFTFDFDDIVVLNETYGDISVLQQIGNTLKCYQEFKVTSFYLGAEQAVDALGTSQLSYSSNVIGNSREAIEKYGTIFPKSYARNNRNAYFFDINQGVVVRDSPNGLEPISDYKMKTYFKSRAKELIEDDALIYDIIDVYGRYDEIKKMYFITFKGKTKQDTLAFHEPTNRWISYYSFTPELYGSIGGTSFFSFKDGALYLHNSDPANRNTFYGTAYNSEIWITSNSNPDLIKLFNSIEIHSTDIWEMPDTGDIVIEATTKYPNGMSSRLKAAKFRNREGVYEAAFLRDMLTKSNSPSQISLFDGRPLRGREITLKLHNDNTNEVILFAVHINSQQSK